MKQSTIFHLKIVRKLRLVSFFFYLFQANGGKGKSNARSMTPALPFARDSPFTRACLALVRASEISGTWSKFCAVSLNSAI